MLSDKLYRLVIRDRSRRGTECIDEMHPVREQNEEMLSLSTNPDRLSEYEGEKGKANYISTENSHN